MQRLSLAVLVVAACINSNAETFVSQTDSISSIPPRVIEPSFSADRPGIGLSSSVVSPGSMQMESGFAFTMARRSGATSQGIAIGSPLTRWGIAPGIEVRFQGDGYRFRSTSGSEGFQRLKGLGDTNLGTKVRLVQPGRWKPEVSVVAELWMPSGAKNVSRGGATPSASVVWSTGLPGKFGLGGTASLTSMLSGPSRVVNQSTAVSISRPLWKDLSSFVEASYDRMSSVASTSPWIFDAGLSRIVAKNYQVDVSAGHNFVRNRASWFCSAGVVISRPRAAFAFRRVKF